MEVYASPSRWTSRSLAARASATLRRSVWSSMASSAVLNGSCAEMGHYVHVFIESAYTKEYKTYLRLICRLMGILWNTIWLDNRHRLRDHGFDQVELEPIVSGDGHGV